MLLEVRFAMPAYGTHHFAEKVALISDVSSPVGRAVSIQLALLGSYVVGVDPKPQPDGAAAMEELVALGTLARYVAADPGSIAGCRVIADEVLTAFGRLDLLVNCLKKEPKSSFENETEAEFSFLMRANLGSVKFLIDAVTDLMKDRPGPRIVNVAWAGVSDPTFSAAQSAIISYSEMAARTLPKNYRLNCVSVGKKMNETGSVDAAANTGLRDIAADDVARAVLFLLSSESAGMNGQVLRLGHAFPSPGSA